ncbi:MAG: hypothetical protein ABI610_04650 [Acidobacteriota bacterium]
MKTPAAFLLFFGVAAARAQTLAGGPPPSPTPSARPLTFHFNNFYLYDSNINHSGDDPRETRGAVFGLQALYRTPADRPELELSYEIARHFHTAEEWDRVSHNFRADWERRVSRDWAIETVGEVSLKGSTEDRDISDQYVFSPRVEYRVDRQNRLRGYAAYRIRKFEGDPDRDARNHYFGAEYAYRSGGVRRLDVGLRYEENRAEAERHRYTRWTYYAQFTTPVTRRDRLDIEARYRPRRYQFRTIDHDDNVLRYDKNWILSSALIHTFLAARLDLSLEYRFETRSSNDAGKNFNEHSVGLGLGYHF